MDQGVWGATDVDADSATAESASPDDVPRRRRRAPLWVDLTLLGIVGVILVAAVAAGAGVIYREFYSPSAFVERYLGLLADQRAADALAVPGVQVDSVELETAGLPPTAHDALLRPDALASLTDVRVVDEQVDAELTLVTVEYVAGGMPGASVFVVERLGSVGLAPTWSFAVSPLTVLDVTVSGSRVFEVNGFAIDQRQVSPDGVDADPAAPVALLALSPGLYTVSVDTPIAETPGADVLADTPFTRYPTTVEAEPTEAFHSVVQLRVEEFLNECATQQVLQPTACPFGYTLDDRIVSAPVWSIAQQPVITLEPTDTGWRIPSTEAVAHLEVDVQSLFDGTINQLAVDVPFTVVASIAVQSDGTATITVGGAPIDQN